MLLLVAYDKLHALSLASCSGKFCLGKFSGLRSLHAPTESSGDAAIGATEKVAVLVAANSRRWWHNSVMALNRVLTIAYFDRLGVRRLS
jgi:hypothetical protein